MSKWESAPDKAWRDHIIPSASNPRWVEDSQDISATLKLNKRELFALIVLAHLYNKDSSSWVVGYNESDEEPNDGYITNDITKMRIEHKVVVQMEKREVLEAILGTYKKNADKGPAYGKGRILVIQPNKSSDHGGLIKISDLTHEIGNECPFDQVLTLYMVAKNGRGNCIAVMHVTQHYPPPNIGEHFPGKGMAQVDFNLLTGNATVPHCGIEHNANLM